MTRRPDPIVRRVLLHDRARARTKRRVAALILYLEAYPDRTRDGWEALERLDDLVGEADALRRRLA